MALQEWGDRDADGTPEERAAMFIDACERVEAGMLRMAGASVTFDAPLEPCEFCGSPQGQVSCVTCFGLGGADDVVCKRCVGRGFRTYCGCSAAVQLRAIVLSGPIRRYFE